MVNSWIVSLGEYYYIIKYYKIFYSNTFTIKGLVHIHTALVHIYNMDGGLSIHHGSGCYPSYIA